MDGGASRTGSLSGSRGRKEYEGGLGHEEVERGEAFGGRIFEWQGSLEWGSKKGSWKVGLSKE